MHDFEAAGGLSGSLIFVSDEVDLPPMAQKFRVPRESPMFYA